MEMLDIFTAFDSVVQLIRILVLFTPMVHMVRFLAATTHYSLRYQAEGHSPFQSGVQSLPFLLSLVVCEYGLLFTRKLITKLNISGHYFWSPDQGTVFFQQA